MKKSIKEFNPNDKTYMLLVKDGDGDNTRIDFNLSFDKAKSMMPDYEDIETKIDNGEDIRVELTAYEDQVNLIDNIFVDGGTDVCFTDGVETDRIFYVGEEEIDDKYNLFK